jgi:hypothetical protein
MTFLAALAGSAALAVGFALAADRIATFTAPAPRLTTVPPSVLAQAGYSVAAAVVPPYCGAEQAAAQRGWMPGGSVGCPITREQAERATGDTAQESELARVTATRAGAVGQDHLTWIVVARPKLQVMFLCVGLAISPACPAGTTSVTSQQAVVLVDAYTGRVLDIVTVNRSGPVPPIHIQPLPTSVPIRPPTVEPIPRPSPVVTDAPSGP